MALIDKVPDAKRKEICDLYKSGVDTVELAKIARVSRRTMQYWLKAWFSEGHRHGAKLNESDISQIIEMRKEGATLDVIAEKTGISKSTVGRIVKQCCGSTYAPRARKLAKEQEMPALAMLNRGATVAEVAKKFNTSSPVIYYLLRKHNCASARQTQECQNEQLAREIKRLSVAGKMNSEIATELHVPEEVVVSHIGISGYAKNAASAHTAKRASVLPVGAKVWALQPRNTSSITTASYEEVPATIMKVYPRIYDCVTDNGYHVSVQIASAKRVIR